MKRDFKTGILLIAIGIFATVSLVFITGKQAVARNDIPNPAYGFGFCVYKMQGDIAGCYESIRHIHTGEQTLSLKGNIK